MLYYARFLCFVADFSLDDATYSRLSPIDSFMQSHTNDSAIIKTEIFDPAFDRLLAYDHDFLSGMDVPSNFLTSAHRSYSDSALNQSLTEKSPEAMQTNLLNDASSSKSETDVQHVFTAAPVTSSQSPSVNSLGNSQHMSPTPTVAAAAAVTSSSAAAVSSPPPTVLTTPVYIAQGAPGPAGQTNSIITTHMARLVPSPDGKGYILHLGLNPSSASTAASSGNSAMTSSAASAALAASAAISSNNSSQSAPSAAATTAGSTCSVSPLSPLAGAPRLCMNHVTANPASLNITITPAQQTAVSAGTGVSAGDVNMTGTTAAVNQRQHDMTSLASPTVNCGGGVAMDTTDTQPQQQASSIVTAAHLQLAKQLSNASDLMQLSDPSLSANTSAAAVLTCGNNSSTAPPPQATTMTLSPAGGASMTLSPASMALGPALIAHPASALSASSTLLTELTREQLVHQMQVLQRQQAQLNGTASGGGANGGKGKSSKRRNSRELRDLIELDKISVGKNGELDRFVICSDGPMNCALCGYNTDNYSSFKSHIICSHPCWRITKKLSRNRLLVEKSVKVSIPVANFSVPNPVPAVPIQRVQASKKNKKDSSSSSGRQSRDADDVPPTHTDSSKTSSKDRSPSMAKNATNLAWLADEFDFDVVNSDADDDDSDEMMSSSSSPSAARLQRSLSASAGGARSTANNVTSSSSSSSRSSHGRDRTLAAEPRSERLFRCARCHKQFVFEGTALNHVSDVHKLSASTSLEHIQMSADGGKTFGALLRCSYGNCRFRACSQGKMERHRLDVHADVSAVATMTSQGVFRCQICGYFADSTEAVREHVDRIHPQQDMMFGLTD